MPSTFTTNTGIEKIGDGEQSGLWGQTTNVNFDIVDRALNGVLPIALLSTAYTLTTSSGGLSEGQAAAVIFTGSLGSAGTITVAPNNAQKTYIISNQTNQDLTITQGSGGDVTVQAGTATIVLCTGEGSTASVIEAVPPAPPPPEGGVTAVTANAPLASSGGVTPNITLASAVAINRGGTNATTAAGARTNLGLGTIATQNSTNVSITGGSVSATLSGNGSGVTNLNATQVATAYSSILPGARGTYVLARVSGTLGFSVGGSAAGSSLTPSNTVGTASGSLSGSWEACGHVPSVGTTSERTTLWLRIS